MDYGFSINVSGNSLTQMRQIEAELQRLGVQASTTTSSISGSFSSMGSNITASLRGIAAAAGLAFGVQGIVNFGKSILEAGTKVEDATTGLTTLLKSRAEAAMVIQNTMQDAIKTPFAFEGLLSANKALISANVSAVSARKTILDLANAIAATGGGDAELQRMVVNLQQIKNLGRASAIDIKQFAYAGINIYEALAKATGKPIDQVKELSVSYEMLAFALSKARAEGGIYARGLENMANNTSIQISNLGDQVFQLSVQMFNDLKPAISAIIKNLSDLITRARDVWSWLVKNKDTIMELGRYVKIAAEAYLIYKGYLLATSVAVGAVTLAETLLGTAILRNTAATVANSTAMAANQVVVGGFGAMMNGVTVSTNAATTAATRFATVWKGIGIGLLVTSLANFVNSISEETAKLSQQYEKISQFQATRDKIRPTLDDAATTWQKYNNDAGLSKETKSQILSQAIASREALKGTNVATEIGNLTRQIAALKEDEALALKKSGEPYNGTDYTQRVINDQAAIKDLTSKLDELKRIPGYITGYQRQMQSVINDYMNKQGIKPLTDGTATGTGQLAYNTSMLSGASGGLGQAKQIHITFNGPFQQNNGVKESKEEADQAIQKMVEMINGFSDSQTAI